VPALTLAAVLVMAWIFLAPLPLAGKNSYLVTSGTSMLPDIKRGDLVVTRRVSVYRVGDVVAYREPRIGAVLHRIVAIEGEHYVLQGDNNDFLDPYRPMNSEIMGKQAVHVPGAGTWLARMRQPRNAAMLALAGGMVLAVPAGANKAQQSRARQRRGSGSHYQPTSSPPGGGGGLVPGPAGQLVALVVGCVVLFSLVLAGLAYSTSTERRAYVPLSYEQRGEFSYSAEMSGTVYPGGVATTGAPVYRKLADEMAISFDYSLTSDLPANVSGVYRMDAVISQDDGWKRSVPVVETTAFEGTHVSVQGVLQLDVIQAEIDSAREQTGLDSQPLRSYTVSLVPAIEVDGTLGSVGIAETFAPGIDFIVEPLLVKVKVSSGMGDEANPFSAVTTGTVSDYRSVPNHVALPGYQLPVETARRIAQAGLAVSVLGMLVLAVIVVSASTGDEPKRIRVRYGPMLVSLKGSDLGEIVRLIEVQSIDDLVRVAEREGRMVLHQESGSIHQYFVQDADVTYRYQTNPVPAVRGRRDLERAL
jgi:signal peptidase I